MIKTAWNLNENIIDKKSWAGAVGKPQDMNFESKLS